MITRYSVAAIQSDVHVADEHDPSSVERTIKQNLQRNMELVDYVCGEPRYGPKLIVFSEFCLTGVPESRSLQGYLDFSVHLPGWVTEIIGERAKRHGVYICCNTFEKDEEWPNRSFNTSFIVGPTGDVILRYRKNNDTQAGIPCSTNPGEFYSAYVERYGVEGLFPVVDTEIGRLGCITCNDVRFAETARMLALQGCEVMLHPTAEGSGPLAWRSSWDAAKQVRAWENMAYFVSVNNGLTHGSTRPMNRQRGLSRIFDYEGRILAQTDGQGETAVTATVDIEQLRQVRSAIVNFNVVATSRWKIYEPLYRKYETWPVDLFLEEPMQNIAEPVEFGREKLLKKLYEQGTFIPPVGAGTASSRRAPF